jgi:hypothetical protein
MPAVNSINIQQQITLCKLVLAKARLSTYTPHVLLQYVQGRVTQVQLGRHRKRSTPLYQKQPLAKRSAQRYCSLDRTLSIHV